MHTANPATAGVMPRLESFNETRTGKFLIVVSASLFVAACAHAIVPLPFTVVPLTLSDLAVLIVGLALGPRAGFATLALYLAEGAAGMPVFSPAGPGGIAQILGPTGGFLLAYPFAAAVAGGLRRAFAGWSSRFLAALSAGAVASALIMVCGLVWLGFLLHLSPATAFMRASAPFLPGQVVKVICAAGIVTSIQRLRRKD